MLYLNTLVIIASSFTLEIARRRIAAVHGRRRKDQSGEVPRAGCTSLCSWDCFLLPGKLLPGCNCRSQGFGLATNISYSFFYVLTVAHALHLLGGLGGLVRVIGETE